MVKNQGYHIESFELLPIQSHCPFLFLFERQENLTLSTFWKEAFQVLKSIPGNKKIWLLFRLVVLLPLL